MGERVNFMTILKTKTNLPIEDAESLMVTVENAIARRLAQQSGVIYPVLVIVELWAGEHWLGIERCLFEALPCPVGE